MNRLLLPAFCAAILTSHVQALTDINGNGLSDDWEKFFNNDQLFSPTNPDHAPGADPDGDGWTNLQEATAGTDPFDPHPPAGIIVPAIEITPATYEPLHEGSEPPPSTEPPPTDPFAPSTPAPPAPPRILLDPPEIRLTWHTIPGKTYRSDHRWMQPAFFRPSGPDTGSFNGLHPKSKFLGASQSPERRGWRS